MSIFEWFAFVLLALLVVLVFSLVVGVKALNHNVVHVFRKLNDIYARIDRIGAYSNESALAIKDIQVVVTNQFEYSFPHAELRKGGF